MIPEFFSSNGCLNMDRKTSDLHPRSQTFACAFTCLFCPVAHSLTSSRHQHFFEGHKMPRYHFFVYNLDPRVSLFAIYLDREDIWLIRTVRKLIIPLSSFHIVLILMRTHTTNKKRKVYLLARMHRCAEIRSPSTSITMSPCASASFRISSKNSCILLILALANDKLAFVWSTSFSLLRKRGTSRILLQWSQLTLCWEPGLNINPHAEQQNSSISEKNHRTRKLSSCLSRIIWSWSEAAEVEIFVLLGVKGSSWFFSRTVDKEK